MTRPLVSVVVPTYDRAGYVETAVRSLLDQDYPELEVIVLDDGSEDATPEILARIAEHADPERFRWERHDNVGQAATINRGFELARGELLGYVSSDDYLLPGAIEELVAAAERNPAADVVYGGWHGVDDRDRVLFECSTLEHSFLDSLRWGLCIVSIGALMRRRCYERIGGWDERLRFCPDYEWWLRVGDAEFEHVPRALGCWRAHDGSISMGSQDVEGVRRRLAERMLVLDELFAQPGLSEEVRAVEAEAYASVMIDTAAILDQGVGSPGRRYVLEDRTAPRYNSISYEDDREARLWYDRKLRSLEQRLQAVTYEKENLAGAVEKLEAVLDSRERRAAQPARRPVWLRAARRLVPAGLRPRVGAAVHRARRSVG